MLTARHRNTAGHAYPSRLPHVRSRRVSSALPPRPRPAMVLGLDACTPRPLLALEKLPPSLLLSSHNSHHNNHHQWSSTLQWPTTGHHCRCRGFFPFSLVPPSISPLSICTRPCPWQRSLPRVPAQRTTRLTRAHARAHGRMQGLPLFACVCTPQQPGFRLCRLACLCCASCKYAAPPPLQ
jgi:hypothetical protein